MIAYSSTSGKVSGVTAYEIGDTFIKVRFHGTKTYTYTESLNGKQTIERMKQLAVQSRGLSTYIAQNRSRLKYR